MDTILENNDLGLRERAVLPTVPHQLTAFERFVTKRWYKLTDFVVNHFCCGSSTYTEDWEFDVLTTRTVESMLDDDIEFSDLVAYFNHATAVELQNEKFVDQRDEGVDAQLNLRQSVPYISTPDYSVGSALVVRNSAWGTAEISIEGGEHMTAVRRGLKWRRRRKRVVAFCVVALVNKVRCKYFHMDDTTANRRLVGSYLLKLMREHNFRNSDIHLHVHYAVEIYFGSCATGMKPTVYARG